MKETEERERKRKVEPSSAHAVFLQSEVIQSWDSLLKDRFGLDLIIDLQIRSRLSALFIRMSFSPRSSVFFAYPCQTN